MSQNSKTTFYIVRHGQTDWNAKHLIQGQTDIPLNDEGEKQAHTVAELLHDIHFDKVFSSDLLRAKRTAEIITLEKQLAIETSTLLRERNFGPLEAKHLVDLRALEEKLEDLVEAERFSYKHHPDMESDEEVVGRFLLFLRETSVAYLGKTILVVCHGGIMRTLLVHLGYATYEDFRKVRIENTAFFTLFSDGIEFSVGQTVGIHKEE